MTYLNHQLIIVLPMISPFQKHGLYKKFNPSFMRETPSRIDLIYLYEHHTKTQLKTSGRALTGRCPFHADSSPSFAIYQDTQSVYCFGCHYSASAQKFKKDIQNV